MEKVGGEGRGDEAAIKRRFAKHKSEIIACYDTEIRAGNLAKGTVQFEFTVWTDGCSAEVKGRFRDKGLRNTANCIVGILKGFCFDEPSGGAVRYRSSMYFEPAPPKRR